MRMKEPTTTSLFCYESGGVSEIQVSVIGKANRGITAPEFVSITQNGETRVGFQKKDENSINNNDLECLLYQIGSLLSVPMAEVLRTFKDPDLKCPYSLISISVAQHEREAFVSFSDIQDELFDDLSSGAIRNSSWIQRWSTICDRRAQNPPGIWELYATSKEDCEASFQYPFETAGLWTQKHAVTLVDFEASIIKMVLFDILVGQTDRGQDNYGLLVDWEKKQARLAPLFDNATLKKPGLDERLNGFNRLLISRELFADCAYGFWKDQFAVAAKSFLSKEDVILKLLSECDGLSPDDHCLISTRILSSIRYLNKLVNGVSPDPGACNMPFIDEDRLCREIRGVFEKKNMAPTRIALLGKIDYEPKFLVQTADNAYFVKFSAYDRFYHELQESMRRVKERIDSAVFPLFSVNLPSLKRQINVYHWYEGIPLSQIIRSKSTEECYCIGNQCGALLRAIHNVKPLCNADSYDIGEHLTRSMRVLFEKPELLIQRDLYLPQMHIWSELLTRSHELSVVHMDYVPKNLICTENGVVVIDWDSCEITHPWLDFFDKGLALYPERQAFNTGVIDGYFDGMVPLEFWDYFKALTVFALVRMSAWAVNQNNPSYVNLVEQHVCDSYRNFQISIPLWYIQHSNAGKMFIHEEQKSLR